MRRLMTGFLAAALTVCACGPGAAARAASAGAASGTWSVQRTPDASGVGLQSVSCTLATACTATGAKVTGGIYRTVAEAWHGTSWSAEPTPAIPGGTDSFLRGVSCTTAASCTAAGDYWNGTMDVPLAERWNGTRWSIEPAPMPSGSRSSYLFGVSCTAPAACTAVGDFIDRAGIQRTLAERWNGSAWSIQPTPNPPGGQGSVLLGVSCIASTVCTAVGEHVSRSGSAATLAEEWHGSAWSIQPTPNHRGAQQDSLAAVSCTAPAACTAVGNYSNNVSSTLTLAEAWHGSTWSIQSTPDSPSAAQSYLSGVSCTSARACTASGYFRTHGGTDVTLAEGWNRSAWSIQPTARPVSAVGSFLDGVSCTSVIDCTAVGDYINGVSTTVALVERHSAG